MAGATDGSSSTILQLYNSSLSSKFSVRDDGFVDVAGNMQITTDGNDSQLTLKSTDADSSVGPVLDLVRDSASPADGDAVGQIKYIADNDAGEATTYSSAFTTLRDASDGAEDGQVINYVVTGGSLVDHLRMGRGSANGQSEVTINEGSEDIDFRVESNGNANMLFVDGGNDKVAIGTGTAVGTLTTECTAGDSNFALTAYHPTSTSSRNIAKFQSNVGSTQADVVTIGCDGGIEAIGEITTTNSLSQSSNSIRTVIGNDGGSATFGTSTNHQLKLFTNNNHVATLTTGGFLTLPAGSVVSPHVSSSTAGISLAPEGSIRATAVGTQVFEINRIGDGQIGRFREGGSEEGNISVSGTTVSYNGGHLSRYSQFTDGNRIDGLVKGTVMTNLDQMAKWHHEAKAATLYEDGDEIPEGKKVGDEKTPAVDAYDEDNEQLNCMAVSSVEGDVDVAGVFVNWDDDDEYFTADMNIAMTGDMVIRIAQDTTVARGDLLMSAGDGTAKPQGDDIVRSKTIAKVTSTTKSHTYDDGSYLVPCVLMAC